MIGTKDIAGKVCEPGHSTDGRLQWRRNMLRPQASCKPLNPNQMRSKLASFRQSLFPAPEAVHK